jgi:transposase-like protein
VTLRDGGRNITKAVHALVAEAFLGPRPVGGSVNHIDGDHHNNVVANLEWASSREQEAHALRTGLKARGNRISTAKLTGDDVQTIRSRYAAGGVSQAALAREYGVSAAVLSKIVLDQSWRHVDGDPRIAAMRAHGPLVPRGEAARTAKLTETSVREARSRRAAGETVTSIARSLGVDVSTMSALLNGHTWRHLL